MPRTTDSTMLAALVAPSLQPALFVALTFKSGVAYVWSGAVPVTWNGQTWAGMGSFLGLYTVEDGYNVEARGTAVTISGLDATLLGDCLGDFIVGLPAAIYLGLYVGGSLYPTAIPVFVGCMDQAPINVSGDKATITLNLESKLLGMNVAIDRRYTPEDQAMDWPQDLGMQFVPGLQEVTEYWMSYPNNTNNV